MVDQLPTLDAAEMLVMGYTSMDDLFSDVPVDVRMQEDLPLRPPTEEEIIADARRLLGANVPRSMASFIGRGSTETTCPQRSSSWSRVASS